MGNVTGAMSGAALGLALNVSIALTAVLAAVFWLLCGTVENTVARWMHAVQGGAQRDVPAKDILEQELRGFHTSCCELHRAPLLCRHWLPNLLLHALRVIAAPLSLYTTRGMRPERHFVVLEMQPGPFASRSVGGLDAVLEQLEEEEAEEEDQPTAAAKYVMLGYLLPNNAHMHAAGPPRHVARFAVRVCRSRAEAVAAGCEGLPGGAGSAQLLAKHELSTARSIGHVMRLTEFNFNTGNFSMASHNCQDFASHLQAMLLDPSM